MSLEDSMAVTRDADRISKKDLRNAKARARRAAAKAAKEMNKKFAATVGPLPSVPAKSAPLTAARVTVKQMVLDVFYCNPGAIFSAPDAVAAIRNKYPGANESSIRVWISDFQSDGTIKKAGKDGRKVLLKSGEPGKLALR